jgi:hypothetical protein
MPMNRREFHRTRGENGAATLGDMANLRLTG